VSAEDPPAGMPPGDDTPRTPPETEPTPGSRTVEGRDSIVERFRGTEWDTRTQPVDPMLLRRSSNRASQAIVVVGLAVLLAAVGGGAFVLLQPGSTPLSTEPSPWAGPTEVDAPVLAAFWKLVEPPTLSYHLESSGSMVYQRQTSTFTLSLDIAGDDFTGRLNEIGGAGRVTFVRHTGVLYLRVVGQKQWTTLETSDRARRESPFMGLDDHRELVSTGPFIEGGTRLYRLISTPLYRPSVERMLDLYLFQFPFPAVVPNLELIVTEAGVPVRATFTVTVAADVANAVPAFKGTSTFTFSKFGQVVKIAAPA
jgi:hypothetical protein